MNQQFKAVKQASRSLNLISPKEITAVLLDLAEYTLTQIPFILEENAKDLIKMAESDPRFDRLKLTEERINGIVEDIISVAKLPNPLGIELDDRKLSNGLELRRVSVPLGVVGIIYEARPNVTFDVFSLCLKSGNACILKGGSDAEYSNKAIVEIIKKVLQQYGINESVIELLPCERSSTDDLLQAVGFIDVLIPRGSQELINYVRDHAKVPLIETGAGIVHTYIDDEADPNMSAKIVSNAKTRRVSVCNALDCLIIHHNRLIDLYEIVSELSSHDVHLYADEHSYSQLEGIYPDDLLHKATKEHFGTEFLSYKMAIKTVESIDEALEHIDRYSSKHSEAIVTENADHAEYFQKAVDAAVVYVNASTAFTDGAQFGLGSEIGISTQKLHARGPMGLAELTSYKWLINGDGQIRA